MKLADGLSVFNNFQVSFVRFLCEKLPVFTYRLKRGLKFLEMNTDWKHFSGQSLATIHHWWQDFMNFFLCKAFRLRSTERMKYYTLSSSTLGWWRARYCHWNNSGTCSTPSVHCAKCTAQVVQYSDSGMWCFARHSTIEQYDTYVYAICTQCQVEMAGTNSLKFDRRSCWNDPFHSMNLV